MSILNVNNINPVGSGRTITVNNDVDGAGVVDITGSLNVAAGDNGGYFNVLSNKLYLNNDNVTLPTLGARDTAVFARNSNCRIVIATDSGSNSVISFADENSNTIGQIQYDHSVDDMQFKVNGSERMRIDASGNFGIGTDNPESKLVVAGDSATARLELKRTNAAGSGSYGAINFTALDGHSVASIHATGDGDEDDNGGDIVFRTTSAATTNDPYTADERLRITSSGNIQIPDDTNVTFGNDGASDTKIYYSGANDFLDIGLKSGSKINIFNISDVDNYMQFYLETGTAQIGDTFSGNTDKKFIFFSNPNGSTDPGFIMHETRGGTESNEGIIHLCPSDDNASSDYVSIHGTNDVDRIKLQTNGDISTPGSISKGSGSFSIPHPLAGLSTTNNLVHSFVEAPDASNLYAGMVDLVDGTATVNIDIAHRMTEGTFVALNDVQSWSSSNESGYSPVKCSISGNLLTIECQDTSSTDTVYYEVRGIRKDQHMIDAHWTDENGRVITEPQQ